MIEEITPSDKSTQYISYSGIIASLAVLSIAFMVLLVMSEGQNLICPAKLRYLLLRIAA
jgi:hypothetical protein